MNNAVARMERSEMREGLTPNYLLRANSPKNQAVFLANTLATSMAFDGLLKRQPGFWGYHDYFTK